MSIILRATLLSFLVPILLSGCGGGGGTSSAQPAEAPKSVAEAITAADKSGSLPALNRDTTVSGPDSDSNGVRDDIDTYISSLSDTTAQKNALRQMSIALGKAMVANTANQSSLLSASKLIADASACTHARYDSSTASKKNAEIEKLTVNTKTRFLAYEKFSAAISGTSFVLPQGDGCAN